MIYLKHIPDNTPMDLEVSVGSVVAKETFIWGNTAQTTISAMGGRVNILDVEAPGSIPQVDGTYALDLTAVDAAETRRFTTPQGQQVSLEIAAPTMWAKWGDGIHYQLERNPTTEDLIIEPGRNHRKVYVTMGPHGYTPADIAAEVGGGLTAAQVTPTWLAANPTWGATPEKALDFAIGIRLWYSITVGSAGKNPRQSNWLLCEAGYIYDNTFTGMNDVHYIPPQCNGESLLHPMVITRYGTGATPILAGRGLVTFGCFRVAIIGVAYSTKVNQINGHYVIMADLESIPGEAEMNLSKDVSYRTLYRCKIADVRLDVPRGDGLTWSAHRDRVSGIFMNDCIHGLIEDTFFDHNGWTDGWTMDVNFANSPSEPPDIYSHNMYLSFDNRDLTVIGCLSARGSSMGMQMRSGGRIQDNLFLDNQQHATVAKGGGTTEEFFGQHTLLLGNFITSASHMDPFPGPDGAHKHGIDITSAGSSAIDNVIAHLADPNNPAEIAAKDPTSPMGVIWKLVPPIFDNTIDIRWSAAERNTQGLDRTLVNNRAIQKFIATKVPTGMTPTIKNFLNWAKTLTPRQRQVLTRDALDFLRFPFYGNMEVIKPKRTVAATTTFLPDQRGEGRLWDNRLNWTTGDLPGTVAADTVDLHGNFVRFGRLTQTVASIKFDGGILEVVSGKLTAQAHADEATVWLQNSGQYSVPANGHGNYIAAGSRLIFNGAASVDLEVAGDCECLFGPSLTIPAGKELTIYGSGCWAGWDGTGTASLTVAGTLAFHAVSGGMGKLQRFKRRGDNPTPTVTPTVTLASGSAVTVETGDLVAGTYELTGPGVVIVNNGATLAPGVTLVDGQLLLTV